MSLKLSDTRVYEPQIRVCSCSEYQDQGMRGAYQDELGGGMPSGEYQGQGMPVSEAQHSGGGMAGSEPHGEYQGHRVIPIDPAEVFFFTLVTRRRLLYHSA